MKRVIFLISILFLSTIAGAKTILVKNIEELKEANKKAQPGDIIMLQNGVWNDVTISLTCSGTKEQPIYIKAETPGKVTITGRSKLKIGGNWLVIDGLYFINGYAGDDAVIDFKANKNNLANHCRVTNCAINSFNNPKRLDENYWVSFYGKDNRLDHCSFTDKKNLGVLLAVILDDERSRENFHSIDHNYFGLRLPLASNGGEIIRVGVSQHCEFNSNTQIVDNFFEHCDGETEIVSIKSCANTVRGNLFKECQGGVVLRHGNYNTVENNIFLGNGKEGTGGVRVINKGQWVINNLFYKCRGVDFRSPLSIMNGIPNSPANRYVQVTDAVIANNSFFECAPISFCEGSDTERTLPPARVLLAQNIFYNTKDSAIYKIFDNINGFSFANNIVSKTMKQPVNPGFIKTAINTQNSGSVVLPNTNTKLSNSLYDSLNRIYPGRIKNLSASGPGFHAAALVRAIEVNAATSCGAHWFKRPTKTNPVTLTVNCPTTEDIYKQLAREESLIIRLTGNAYTLDKPFVISKSVRFTATSKRPIAINSSGLAAIFLMQGNGHLSMEELNIDCSGVGSSNFISNDADGSSAHYNLSVRRCTIQNLERKNGCRNFFYANKSMVADSIVFFQNSFINMKSNGMIMNDEKDDKGYYPAEKIMLVKNHFNGMVGVLLDVYRGGNDESTMGPLLIFRDNTLTDCNTVGNQTSMISLYGVQRSFIEENKFTRCNDGSILVEYHDAVRAAHLLRENEMKQSGEVVADKYVRVEYRLIYK